MCPREVSVLGLGGSIGRAWVWTTVAVKGLGAVQDTLRRTHAERETLASHYTPSHKYTPPMDISHSRTQTNVELVVDPILGSPPAYLVLLLRLLVC